MNLWHETLDARRVPERPSPNEKVSIRIGTWPIELGQRAWVVFEITHADGTRASGQTDARWSYNAGNNSYWEAVLQPLRAGDLVRYEVHAASAEGHTASAQFVVRVAPRLCLALMWHQHQPLYKDSSSTRTKGLFLEPWVRLHAIRDYYSMASLVSEYPGVHVTINLTPSLLSQLEDYLENGSVDHALELTLKPAEKLDAIERERVLSTFFDASWHNQIFIHPRYRELFFQRTEGRPPSTQDIADLQAWFNLAWFGIEFRTGDVKLTTGEVASVKRFVDKGRGFTTDDIKQIVAEQYKIMRAVIPIHRTLAQKGQVELSTTPFYHPILPLLVDTDRAHVDRPGATLPVQFAQSDDAAMQVALAAQSHERLFGKPAHGMWPAEGAVAQFVIPFFARHVQWVATDRGVLARSGQWGYRAEEPRVLARAYRGQEADSRIAVFFRDPELSDDIGFRCQSDPDAVRAAFAWVERLKQRFGSDLGEDERIVTVVLDGENAWGSYREDGRPFLRALYQAIEADVEIATVTFTEYLRGNAARGVREHPVAALDRVYELFTGSWIDEAGSNPGADLGTWIGEPDENRAWHLLGQVRRDVEMMGVDRPGAAQAREALLAAEGSDWFWWYGADQDSGRDAKFDELFRLHLTNAYRALGATPLPALARPVIRQPVVWTFTQQVQRINGDDFLTVRTHCPGVLRWSVDAGATTLQPLYAVGGVMAGTEQHELTLGPFGGAARAVRFQFRCTHKGCDHSHPCCHTDEQRVQIGDGG